MQDKLEQLIEQLTHLRDQVDDDTNFYEFIQGMNNALLHLNEASDRLVTIAQELDEADDYIQITPELIIEITPEWIDRELDRIRDRRDITKED